MNEQELEAYKQSLKDLGIDDKSLEWARLVRLAFMNGGYTGPKPNIKLSSVSKENPDKYALEGLLWLLRDYIKNGKINDLSSARVDLNAARQIQKYLIGRGYDLGFVDNLGNYRTDGFAADGRIGDKTIEFLNLEIAALKGSQSNDYERDFYKAYGDALPTYNKVAGRDPYDVRMISNMYYNYYKKNPALYAGLLKDKNLSAKVLPYLSDEAKSLLSKLSMETYQNDQGLVLNLPEMAYLGLLGSRGLELLRGWELQNVINAKERGFRNLLAAYDMIAGSGQTLMGLVGGPSDELGGLTYTYTWNPVTRQMDKIAVPAPKATVASNLGVTNPVLAFALNTVTDPLAWMTVAAMGDWSPNSTRPVKVASKPRSAYGGVLVDEVSGTPLNGGTGSISVLTEELPAQIVEKAPKFEYVVNQEVTKPGGYIPGKPIYKTVNNRIRDFAGRKHGGANKVVATSTPTKIYVPDEITTTVGSEMTSRGGLGVRGPVYGYYNFPYVVQEAIDKVTPYIASHPGMDMFYIPNSYSYTPGFGFIPTARGSVETTPKPNYYYDTPAPDFVSASYENRPIGRNLVLKDVDTGEVLYDSPSSNTHNAIRTSQPTHRFLPKYWQGDYRFTK